MTAFSPFIPHNERDSSMPVGAVRVRGGERHRMRRSITRSRCTLGNYGCDSGVHVFSRADGLSVLHFTSADVDRPPAQRGDLAITTEGDGVEHVDYHLRGQWFDSLSRYWREFAQGWPPDRAALRPSARHRARCASNPSTARSRGASASSPARRGRCALPSPGTIRSAHLLVQPRPARQSAEYAGGRRPGRTITRRNGRIRARAGPTLSPLGRARSGDLAFRDSLFGSSLPPEIIDAVSGTLGILRTRDRDPPRRRRDLGDGKASTSAKAPARGVAPTSGTTSRRSPNLFPALERTLRETEFTYNQLPTAA